MSGFDINQLTISGNLTRDPELRSLPSGQSVCNVRIAHNERRKNQADDWIDVAAYFDVTIWSGLGEWIAKHVAKGDKVVVAGRLRWREYDVDGTSRQAVDITADSVVPVPRTTSSEPAKEPANAAKKAPAKAKAAA
jgi:single-strand DNA-binding protein